MKKALMKLILRIAIAIALWSMNDSTKTKISRSVADRIADLYRALKKQQEQEKQTEPSPDAQEGNAQQPIRNLLRRLFGRDTTTDCRGKEG